MSKIDDLKNKIIQKGMTDEDFEQFKILLRRTPGDFLKHQHCYTLASSLPKENAEQAIKLIEYGLDTFSNDDLFGVHCSYISLANVYYKIEQYNNAYNSLKKAVSIVDESNSKMSVSCDMDLLWMKMHTDSFEYSKELEDLYIACQKQNEFTKALINNQFRLTIAEIIIMIHHGRLENAEYAYNKACEMLAPDYTGALNDVLKKHRVTETIDITRLASEYLKNIKKIIEH